MCTNLLELFWIGLGNFEAFLNGFRVFIRSFRVISGSFRLAFSHYHKLGHARA